ELRAADGCCKKRHLSCCCCLHFVSILAFLIQTSLHGTCNWYDQNSCCSVADARNLADTLEEIRAQFGSNPLCVSFFELAFCGVQCAPESSNYATNGTGGPLSTGFTTNPLSATTGVPSSSTSGNFTGNSTTTGFGSTGGGNGLY